MPERALGLEEILEAIRPTRAEVLGEGEVSVTRAVPLPGEGGPHTLTFLREPGAEASRRLRENGSRTAIVGPSWSDPLPGVVLLRVPDPRLAFARVLRVLAPRRPAPAGIHPAASLSPGATLGDGVSIGPYAVVGEATIGEGSVIGIRATVGDGAVLGRRVRIHEGAVIGTTGFGFVRNEAGDLEPFPQVGTVVLEDDVEVFPLANVDRGAMGVTRIGAGSRIDHHAHVSHECAVGRQTLVCAHAVMGGGSSVGDRSFLGVGALLREKVRVGNGVTVGMGAVVVRDVPDGETVAGVPARPLGRR